MPCQNETIKYDQKMDKHINEFLTFIKVHLPFSRIHMPDPKGMNTPCLQNTSGEMILAH